MPVKIRLQRHGKKASAFFHIVIADGRAPRDGKFIEKIGTYNPTTNPATIELDSEKALTWLQNGAQPTDTCRAILSYKGLMYKNHLQGGIAKGALTQEQADAKLAKWISEKETKINAKVSKLATGEQDSYKKRLAAEVAAKDAKAAKILAKNTPPPAPVAEAAAAPDAEAPPAEA
jgi:small subunit ribosomal protein S16